MFNKLFEYDKSCVFNQIVINKLLHNIYLLVFYVVWMGDSGKISHLVNSLINWMFCSQWSQYQLIVDIYIFYYLLVG